MDDVMQSTTGGRLTFIDVLPERFQAGHRVYRHPAPFHNRP